MVRERGRSGFTIVELLVVIVVIALLAAIAIVGYNGIQDRARSAKIESDLSTLNSAIIAARVQTGMTLWEITGGPGVTGDACGSQPSGTDLAALASSDTCWVKYNDTLDQISSAGGANVRGLVDPYGRPYWIYENEGRLTPTDCTQDVIGTFENPHVQWGATNQRSIENSLTSC